MNGQNHPPAWWNGTVPPPPPPPPPVPGNTFSQSFNMSQHHQNFIAQQNLSSSPPGYGTAFLNSRNNLSLQHVTLNGSVAYSQPPTQQPQPQHATLWPAPVGFNAAQKNPPPPPPPIPPPPPLPAHHHPNHQQREPLYKAQTQPAQQLSPDQYRYAAASQSFVAIKKPPPPPPSPQSPSIVPQQVQSNNTNKKRKRNKKLQPVPREVRDNVKVGQSFQGKVIRHKAEIPTRHRYATRGMTSFAEQLDAKGEELRQKQEEEKEQLQDEVIDLTDETDEANKDRPSNKRGKARMNEESLQADEKKKRKREKQKEKRRAKNLAKKAKRNNKKPIAAAANDDTAGNLKQIPVAEDIDLASASQNSLASMASDIVEPTETIATDGSDNRKAQKSRQALEEVKARLLQAKLKKQQAMEEKLEAEIHLKEGLHGDVQSMSSTNTRNTGSEDYKSAELVASRSRKAQEARDKLEAARSKLRGALKNRERAMRKSPDAESRARLPPLSALSCSLVIRNISGSGPSEKVYIREENINRLAVENMLGEEVIQALHAEVPLDVDTMYLLDDGFITLPESSTSYDHISLAARKEQLQEELMSLQEKLEKSQQKAAPGDPAKKRATLCKEDLEKKKVEARKTMDTSYWRHFISKQGHLLDNVTDKMTENGAALMESQKESHETNKNLLETQEEIDEFGIRKRIVEDGIAKSMTALLRARQALYNARQLQASKTEK